MKIEQIYTGCIAQAAYYIENNGEAAIFDPLREVEPYLDKAKKDNAKIKYIFETHFHADFVSGHLDLATKSNGKIVFGTNANPEFEAIIATDNQEFKVGNYTIKAIHTPGHTLESTCYLLIDENKKPCGIITGDTLFIGDVGRPDLAQDFSDNLTQEKLASLLFDSLRNKIMPLPDDIIVYPSHGSGSACGKNMSKETTDTLGNQRKTNYALRADMSREEFIEELLNGLGTPPAYFTQNIKMNSKGYESLDSIIEKSLQFISPIDFNTIANKENVIVLDVRHEDDFVKNHIPNSIFIGIQGQFAPWVGALIGNVNQKLLLITPQGKETETLTRLSRVGFDQVIGILDGGIVAWTDAGFETDTVNSISPDKFASQLNNDFIIVDARKPSEFEAEHVENAINIPLDSINTNNYTLIKQNNFYLYCGGGYRSVIMGSILKSRGIHDFVNIEKGINGIKNTNIKLSNFICPSKSL
jgi:hydroxyacylglutathione hydrolase